METIVIDNVERKLGCLPFKTFPTMHRNAIDAAFTPLPLDSIKASVAGRTGRVALNRRERFSGPNYVRNQGPFGSCNGWSTAGALSRMREIRGEPYVILSGADAYSQMNGNQDNGSILSDGLKVVQTGIAPETMVPFDRIYGHQISAEAKASRERFKGAEPFAVDTEEEFATGLLLGYPGIVAVHATNAFNSQDGDGLNAGGNGVGNHSVLVQDMRIGSSGELWYDMVNSWGLNWCDRGHTWLSWAKHLRETVKHHRFWLLVSTTDDTIDEYEVPNINQAA
jgi:hypothetical protein